MGEYADDALFAGLDQSWGWRRPWNTNLICRQCGAEWLVWDEPQEGVWELTEFDHDTKRYIKHSCKMKNRFAKKKPPLRDFRDVWYDPDDLDDEVPF